MKLFQDHLYWQYEKKKAPGFLQPEMVCPARVKLLKLAVVTEKEKKAEVKQG